MFKWQAEESNRIWITWNKSGQRSFRSNLNKVKSGVDKGDWMDPSMRRSLQAKWNEDEYKKKFEQNKKNRTSEISGSVHTGGSIPFTETRRRLAKELNRELNEFEIFKKTHTRKNDQGQEVWVDHRSQTVAEAFERLNAEASLQSAKSDSTSSPAINEHHIFYQVVSGRNKKGRIYGLGSQGNQSYPSPSGSTYNSSCGSVTQDFEQMKLQFTQMNEENQQMRQTMSQMNTENEQLRQQIQDMLRWRDQMNQMMSRIFSNSTPPGPSRNSPGGNPFCNDKGNDGEDEENENDEDDDC
ncbi:uncharacterized protein LOC127790674 isoform X2 [Diospyros lotus]|nr:uncharacterized protein LOC127790674 isoform X2 [Diospyros lotus]